MHLLQLTAGCGENKNGQAIDETTIINALTQIRELLSVTFGGYTELDSIGGWMHEGRLVQEKGKTWQVAITDKLRLTYAEHIAKVAAKILDQHSVFMVLDGVPQFIEQQSEEYYNAQA